MYINIIIFIYYTSLVYVYLLSEQWLISKKKNEIKYDEILH